MSGNDEHMKNIAKIIQDSNLIDIYTENGDIVKLPILLLSVHSELIASMVSQMQKNDNFNLTVPFNVEVINDIFKFCVNHDASKWSLQTKSAAEMLGINYMNTVSQEVASNKKNKWEKTGNKDTILQEPYEIENERCKYKDTIMLNNLDGLSPDSSSEFIEEIQVDGNIGYICNFCRRPFGSKRWLKRHLEVMHSQTNLHKCAVCDFTTYRVIFNDIDKV